jgi:hypothetical protein
LEQPKALQDVNLINIHIAIVAKLLVVGGAYGTAGDKFPLKGGCLWLMGIAEATGDPSALCAVAWRWPRTPQLTWITNGW